VRRLPVLWWCALCLTHRVAAQGARGDSSAGHLTRSIISQARIDPSQDISFQAMLVPDTVYVGQQATYQVGVFLSDEIRARLRRNPEFVPPEVRSMLAFDVPSPPGSASRTVGPRHYDAHVFQRALFPLTAGQHVIPSARLNYALPLSNSFFSREETHSEHTDVLQLVARDPPEAGRPSAYRGAVGRFTAATHMDGRSARVGDPLTITVSVDGVGNVSLLPRPQIDVAWADVVDGDERVALDSTAVLLRGHKDFDWVITPRTAGTFAVPPVRYPYFNPYTERYEIAVTGSEQLKVAPGVVAATERVAADSSPALPIRRIYRGEEPPPLTSHTGYWLAILLAPVPALVLAVVRRPARRRIPSHERVLRSLASASGVDAPTLRRAYAAAIAARVMTTAAQMSNHRELVRTLRRAGVSDGTARDADHLLAALDEVVYGHAGTLAPNAARRALDIVRAIDVEARSRPALAARATPVAMILLVTVAVAAAGVAAAAPDHRSEATRAFNDGVRQYDARQFTEARATFFELAGAEPRAADAWMNFGAASWQAHDTAAAAVGWQRALRLQPMADDVRQQLTLTPGFRDGLLGDVPPVSLDVLAAAVLLSWGTGWILLAWRAHRASGRRRAEGFALGLAVLFALAGLYQRETLDGRNAAVVISRTSLRGAPALGEEAGAETMTGEVGRVIGRQGAWTRLRLSDGREGWVEARRVQLLGVE
jgi:hypothetical protein